MGVTWKERKRNEQKQLFKKIKKVIVAFLSTNWYCTGRQTALCNCGQK